jgi:hypothetical protein
MHALNASIEFTMTEIGPGPIYRNKATRANARACRPKPLTSLALDQLAAGSPNKKRYSRSFFISLQKK